MLDNDIHHFNNIFPKDISNEFLFPLENYRVFLEQLSLDPFVFYDTWSDKNRELIINKYWKNDTKLD